MQIGRPLDLAKSQGENRSKDLSLANIINKHTKLYILLYTTLINTQMDLSRE